MLLQVLKGFILQPKADTFQSSKISNSQIVNIKLKPFSSPLTFTGSQVVCSIGLGNIDSYPTF